MKRSLIDTENDDDLFYVLIKIYNKKFFLQNIVKKYFLLYIFKLARIKKYKISE